MQTGHDPESTAAADIAAYPDARFVTTLSGQLLASAIDHLRAWDLLARTGTLPQFAPMTLLRAVLEGAVICRWLVDARVTSVDRTARGIALQLEDYRLRRAFELSVRAPANPAAPAKTAAVRLTELEAARDAAGVPSCVVPATTDLMVKYGVRAGRKNADNRWLFQVLSAFAHAREWRLLAMSLGPTVRLGGRIVAGHMTSNDAVLVGSTQLAIAHLERAVEEVESYQGLRTS